LLFQPIFQPQALHSIPPQGFAIETANIINGWGLIAILNCRLTVSVLSTAMFAEARTVRTQVNVSGDADQSPRNPARFDVY
jgi:hypothetical protein